MTPSRPFASQRYDARCKRHCFAFRVQKIPRSARLSFKERTTGLVPFTARGVGPCETGHGVAPMRTTGPPDC
jgi:hypothetical protein